MRIAFLIFNHRRPEQLKRLLSTIRRQLPDATLVVHNDRFRTSLELPEIESLGDVHLLTSPAPIVWGDFSLVEATWRAMTWMTANVQFDWIVVLSAQDYPIKPLGDLGHYLAGSGADALMHATPIDDLPSAAERRNRRQRYLYQYRPASLRPMTTTSGRLWARLRQVTALPADLFNNVQPYVRIYRYPDLMPWRLGRRPAGTPFTPENPCWFGSVWFSLDRRAVDYLVSFTRDNPNYVEHFRHTICPDESATATLICNAPGIRVEHRALHYVRWTNPKSGHPDILCSRDLAELVNAPGFFARKFDLAADSAILDQLDEHTLRPLERG